MSKKSNEEFEAWFAKTYPLGNLERDTEEVLRKMIAEQAWQASRESLVIELPGALSPHNQDVIKAVGRHIIHQGLKVKS